MISKIFSEAAQKGIYLYLKEGRLAYKASGDDISEDFKKIIVGNKAAIVEFLELQSINNVSDKHQLKPFDRSSIQIPLSYAQQRLWLLDKIDGGGAHYNIPGALKLSGSLDIKAVNLAFTTILERHESLRTYFAVDENNQPTQVIQAAVPFAVPLIDLSYLDDGARQLQLAERVADEFGRTFDLSADLMMRAQLIKVADDEHIVLVSMHHIASDGWSMEILINEFSTLYSAYVQGLENPLAPLPIQYADYAHWQRTSLQGDVLEQQLGYWTKQLANLPIAHSLPLDHSRPSIQSFAGNTYDSHIDVTTSKTLNSLCQTQGATLFMGLHAVFSVLLARYSNETDIVVGSPIANREQAEVAGLIGFFVNTLVLRSDLSENPSFIELLNQSKAMLLDVYAHQQVPFEQIVERLQPERSLSHSALFQVMLVLQNNAQGTLELPGLTLGSVEQRGEGVAKYDLTLNVAENEEGLWLGWEYNTDLFEQDTIASMAKHFELLLKSLVKAPDDTVFSVDMLDEQERHQLLIEWNNTQADYPKEKCIHELFEAQAESNPDGIAVVFEEQELTYQELNEKANQLAHYLVIEKHVTPDTLVGICVERSVDMVIGIIAILKAGGAYVPLDPEYPQARLKYMLDDAQLSTVLTQKHLRETTPVNDAQAVCLDDQSFQCLLHAQSTQNPIAKELGLTSSHLAYVIYTSGSTGNPKGVKCNGKGVINLLNNFELLAPLTKETGCLLWTSLSFDVSVYEIMSALTQGRTLHVITDDIRMKAFALFDYIKITKISSAYIPPFFIKDFVVWLNEQTEKPVIERLLVGVEPILLSYLKQINTLIPEINIINGYGPAEATICSTLYKFDLALVSDEINTPIGKAVNNSQLFVFNRHKNLVPKGVAGELYIGGVGLARGYLNRSDLTAEKFIPNPFFDKNNPSSSERLYKTGDLVRWLPDGNLEFLGRVDHQIKIRGFRIEPGEIEGVLNTHSAVKDSIVLAKESNTGARLVAYVVTDVLDLQDENESFITVYYELIENLRHHLKQSLPDYMVPSAFALMNEFPLTPNGKVDRNAMPEPDMSLQQNTYVAPRTETEKILCELWQEILGIERVGVTDSFFSLGGGSLSAVRMVAQASQRTNTNLNIKELFDSQTIEHLANKIAQCEMMSGVEFDENQELAPDEMELKI